MDNGEKIEKEISIGGFSFKLTNKLMVIVISVAPVIGGAFWGVFEFYNDWMDMKRATKNYVAPDLTEFDKRLALVEETSNKTNDYTRDIKNDIKNDIRKLEKVVEQVERDGKQMSRDTDKSIREIRNEYKEAVKEALHNPMNGR